MSYAHTNFDSSLARRKLAPLKVPLLELSGVGVRPTSNLRRATAEALHVVTQMPRRPDASVLSDSIPLFYIGRNKAGLWVAQEAQGRSGGLFLSKGSALRFAREECEPTGCAVMFLKEPFELNVLNQSDRIEPPFNARGRAPRFPAIVAAAKAGRNFVTGLLRAFASERSHRKAIERELFRGRYILTSKNDDDLPVVK